MQISEVTRRNIIDELKASRVRWHGRLEEVQFLSRLYDLNALESNDERFETMAADIVQHRVNNLDWSDDWVFDDSRLNLLGSDDDVFLRFLCEAIHPVVRTNAEEVHRLLETFNDHLAAMVTRSTNLSGYPIGQYLLRA